MTAVDAARQKLERRIIFLIGAVQFVNILDFMMVMPLGPDFAAGIGVDASRVGIIAGSYTAAACVSGLIASFFLDRFDRRQALAAALLGLVVGTALGGLAYNLETLLAARMLAGIFGGPAAALSLAIIADNIPPERRGRAMGAVAGAFSVASVLGVPAGLLLADLGGWRLPFLSVAGMGAGVLAGAIALLPPQRAHLSAGVPPRQSLLRLLSRRRYWLPYLLLGLAFAQGMILIPNIAAHLQQNLGFPRQMLWLPYMVGGAVSFVGMRLAGKMVDRFGSAQVAFVATILLVAVTYVGFSAFAAFKPVWAAAPVLFVLPVFTVFMLAMSGRNVAHQTLSSKVPAPAERAGFMSVVSAIQHAASAAGAASGSLFLTTGATGALEGIGTLAMIAMALALPVPLLMLFVERGLRRQTVPAAAAAA